MIFDGNDLIAVVVAPLVLIAVGFMLRFTETGVALRASAERSDRALMLGIPVRRLEVLVWTVATMMSFTSVLLDRRGVRPSVRARRRARLRAARRSRRSCSGG